MMMSTIEIHRCSWDEQSVLSRMLINHTWGSTEQKMFLPDREPGPLSQQKFCGSSKVHLPILKGYLGSTLLRDFKAHFESTYILIHIEQWLYTYFWVNICKRKLKQHHVTDSEDWKIHRVCSVRNTAFCETGGYLKSCSSHQSPTALPLEKPVVLTPCLPIEPTCHSLPPWATSLLTMDSTDLG